MTHIGSNALHESFISSRISCAQLLADSKESKSNQQLNFFRSRKEKKMKLKRFYTQKKHVTIRFDEKIPNKILETDLPKKLCESQDYVVGIRGRNVRGATKKTIKEILSKIQQEQTLYLDILKCVASSELLSKSSEVKLQSLCRQINIGCVILASLNFAIIIVVPHCA